MGFFDYFKQNKVETQIVKSIWRNNMWVMSPLGVGILFKLDAQCEVHLVNEDGTTKDVQLLPLAQLRQATFDEIPASRMKVTREKANYLGYV